jgi:hypothetical protein
MEFDKKYRIFAGKLPVFCRDCLVPTLYPSAKIVEIKAWLYGLSGAVPVPRWAIWSPHRG